MIYVVSDIHGQYDRFIELLKVINFTSEDTLYILGDIIDRGPKIVKTIDFVIDKPNIHMILGNHEDMFLNYFFSKSNYDKSLWYYNGGAYTDLELSKLSDEKIKTYVDYFSKLPIEREVFVNNQKFLLVHGNYVTEKEKKYFTDIEYRYQVIWGRINQEDTGPNDKIVIFGHTVTHKYLGKENICKIWRNGNLIGIDCGMAKVSVYGDKCQLACLCLDTMQEFYV